MGGNLLFSDIRFDLVHDLKVVVVSLWPGPTEEQPTPGGKAKQPSSLGLQLGLE